MSSNTARTMSVPPQQSQSAQGQRSELAPDYIVQSQVLAARRASATRRQV